MSSNISIDDSFFIKFHDEESNVGTSKDSFIVRNNIESLNILCNWLIDYHEGVGFNYGSLNSKDSEKNEKHNIKLINKLNIMISLHSANLDLDPFLTNCHLDSESISIDDSHDKWNRNGIIEIFVSKFINRSILIRINKIDESSDKWSFSLTSERERELFDRMIFLINRNNIS